MTQVSTIESILKRDRLVVMTGLVFVFLLSALYTIFGIGMDMSALTMTRMAIEIPGMVMQPASWSVFHAALVFLMWWVMMIAMMLPSAAPMVLLHATVNRKRSLAAHPLAATWVFISGYLFVWGAFSAAVTLLQWALEQIGLVTGMMEIGSPILGGSILIIAGLYQFTPLKYACLKHCQHPLAFITHHWRPGMRGAWYMGLEHGAYCLGCCWFLMVLLLVGGVMNLLWIGGIALYVAIEKAAAGRPFVMRATGVVLTVVGLLMLAKPWLTI